MLARYKLSTLTLFIVTVLSLMPGNQFPESPIQYSDIMVHVIMYVGITWILFKEVSKQYNDLSNRLVLVMVLLIIVYGGILEILQESFIPGRFGSVSDFLANAAGVFSGMIISRKTGNR